MWNDTAPTASVFSVLSADNTNRSSDKYIAYCFHNVEGYSKIGSYEGNGNADGTFVYCGFRPKFVLFKRRNGSDWKIHDAARNTYNPANKFLWPNSTQIESTTDVDILSNGFKQLTTGNGYNGSGQNYLFMAFAETPFKNANAR